MKIKKFNIKNFKGIEEAEIDMSSRVDVPIITLIGLNESGKTTILEALSHFVTGDAVVSKIFDIDSNASEIISLVPIHKKANFTGTIEISAVVSLDDVDIENMANIADEEFDLELDKTKIDKELKITKRYTFKDGNPDNDNKTANIWKSPTLSVKTKRAKKFRPYKAGDDEDSLSDSIWSYTRDKLPNISYFPTFLVDLPQRIYLSEHDSETNVNRYYRHVFQDVLDSLNDNLNLEDHVAHKISAYKESNESPNWFSMFLGSPYKGQVDSVIKKMSMAMGREIIGSWNKIFQRPTSAKSIELDWNIDTEKNNLPYLTIYISDGESRYALHERSLGFRWFFSFLLFTRFKQNTDRETIFLFDEPAANLHAGAQTELLKSFERISEGGHKIIYSTHSHHMINPNWLSGAYIVENKAINYDDNDELSALNNRNTDVVTLSYKNFVSQFPNRMSYFHPVLERIGYVNPGIIPDKPIVVTEGISDFHAFSVIAKNNSDIELKFVFYPGLGAAASGPLISFFIACGRKFLIVLDDDKAGKAAADKYKKDWFLSDDVVFTLNDIDEALKGKKLETLLSDETHKVICNYFDKKKSNKASKKEIGIYFAEKNYTDAKDENFSKDTLARVEKILNFLNNKF